MTEPFSCLYYDRNNICSRKAGIQINTSEIKDTYDNLWGKAVRVFETNSMKTDPNLIKKADDLRRGLTVICRPSRNVQDNVMDFLKEAYEMEPNQYYYKPSELHTTVLSIITCHLDFDIHEIDIARYIEAIRESVAANPSFHIQFRGITASPDCVMVQGFPQDATLQKIRQNIRDTFSKYGLKNTLDERFKTHTAHLTCLRFQKPMLNHSYEFIHFLKQNRNFEFGTSEITDLEFVVNDWYMSDEKTKVLHCFTLNKD